MSHMMLIMDAQRRPEPSRTVETVEAQLRSMLAAGALDLPRPGGGATAQRWAALAGFGRRDLALARLGEGHSDTVVVLAEAGRVAVPGALYGVWAARSRGTGARTSIGTGTYVRVCSRRSVMV
jgi:hypothetical protein